MLDELVGLLVFCCWLDIIIEFFDGFDSWFVNWIVSYSDNCLVIHSDSSMVSYSELCLVRYSDSCSVFRFVFC